MSGSVEAIVAALERLPAVALDAHRPSDSAAIRVGARVIARIDRRHDTVFVSAPPDTLPTLQQAFPSGRPLGRGIEFDLARTQGAADALGAIRRRANVERLVWQFRLRSP
jgi:hypothetical protein